MITEADNNLDYAWEQLNSNENIFLTGNAGTGKSTLIRKFIEANKGECIVVAPTGVAALNIGGQTIHSFFGFPARTINYESVKFLKIDDPRDFVKIMILRKAKFLIIDEISMVRADMMDQIGWFFHKNKDVIGSIPKLIMVGDLDQLPPVIGTEEEKIMLNARYKSEFFFEAKMFVEFLKFTTVKLTKVFRQSDPEFVRLLNDIKNNNISDSQLAQLNFECVNHDLLNPETHGIMLAATNKIAAEVNTEMLSRIEYTPINLEGEITGTFNPKNCPVDQNIVLKIGARVMIMRNDPNKAFVNGSMGTLIEYSELGRYLKIQLDSGATICLPRCEFESIEYKYNKERDKINSNPTGKFIQYPIKLAYAISIHKSQGRTFDKIIIDLGASGAFAHGQTYVALSRCTSMQGITLRRAITRKDLIYNNSVLEFNKI